MIVYRFARSAFSTDLSGEGARLYGGRWNSRGAAVLYTSGSISLSLIELLMHSASYDEILVNQLMVIDTGTDECATLDHGQLKKGWQNDVEYSRFIGDGFLSQQQSLLLKVPSVAIPEEFNYLINPLHKAFKKVKLRTVRTFSFDARLFK